MTLWDNHLLPGLLSPLKTPGVRSVGFFRAGVVGLYLAVGAIQGSYNIAAIHKIIQAGAVSLGQVVRGTHQRVLLGLVAILSAHGADVEMQAAVTPSPGIGL